MILIKPYTTHTSKYDGLHWASAGAIEYFAPEKAVGSSPFVIGWKEKYRTEPVLPRTILTISAVVKIILMTIKIVIDNR